MSSCRATNGKNRPGVAAPCSSCAAGRDHLDGFVFDVTLADGTNLCNVEIQDRGGVLGNGIASSINRGDIAWSEIKRQANALLGAAVRRQRELRIRRPARRDVVEVHQDTTVRACRPVITPRERCGCRR